jgi:maleylpyruvate isomerase
MKLYGYWRSSSTWRVRIALAWKRIPFEYQPVHMLRGGGEQHGDAVQGREPAVRGAGAGVEATAGRSAGCRSPFAIIDYLERVHPQPSLSRPTHSWLAAPASWPRS